MWAWIFVVEDEEREGHVMAEDIVLGAKQLPNPKNVRPMMDTESPDAPRPLVKMDISNPPANQLEPHQHPLEQHFARPKSVRHPLGHRIPNVQVSEN
jgi:hypothetical protein